MSWRPIGHGRGYRICRVHADRYHDPDDPFDLHEVFGLSRDGPKRLDTGGFQFRRFPNFGKELRRPFAVREECYDCAAFYEGCKGWRWRKEEKTLPCRHYQPLPDVTPGTYGQKFPKKVFMPTEPEKQRIQDEANRKRSDSRKGVPKPEGAGTHRPRTSKRPQRKAKAGCRDCGAQRQPGHTYCPKCATSRKAHSNRQRQRTHRLRPRAATKGKAGYFGTGPLKNSTKALRGDPVGAT